MEVNMKKQIYFFVLTFIILFSQITFSFDDEEEISDTTRNYTILSTPFKKYFYFKVRWQKYPSISLFSGLNYPSLSQISSNNKFSSQNFASIQLGNTRIKTKELKNGEKINEISNGAIFLENFSSKWFNKENSNIDANMWRFGVRLSDDGMGYRLGNNNFIFLTHGNSFIWSKFDVDALSNFTQPDSSILGRFSSQFRFGNSFQSGLSFVLSKRISFDLRYERAIVYPGHKFWYWLGSHAIEGLSQFLLDEFIREITYSSPFAGPIVNFILKSGLSYGIYELRKEKMNWPFKTEPPLFNDNLKFGLTFLF